MHLIILGPHGAGKGTQAKLIAKQYGIERVSTGDIIREHIKKGSDWGKKVKQYIDKNIYVPDKLIDVV
ncbi:MAG: nucleoside monophosphate kinase, partial [Candidatus Aenigmarchaeota archaeon]|nr:nucleoside monophosphate kinase [Candidatus Aenigmarchaeota archaeon]